MIARLLRDALVDTPQRMGWRKVLACRVVLVSLIGVGGLLCTDIAVAEVLLALVLGTSVGLAAGWVWRWRIRRRQRTDRPDRWREREARR